MTRLAGIVFCLVLAGCGGGWERMQRQQRADLYEPTSVFDNGTTMQHPPPNTVARREAHASPPSISMRLLERGQNRFNVFCAPCHGVDGASETAVARRMPLRAPPSLVTGHVRGVTRAEIYRVITEGFGFMPSYAPQLDPEERWAVAAYVEALQISRNSRMEHLPPVVQREARAALGGTER